MITTILSRSTQPFRFAWESTVSKTVKLYAERVKVYTSI